MFQFILTNVFMISLGALLYFVIRTLPRIELDPKTPDTKGFFERLVVSRIPERVDGVVNNFLFKFLRKFKVVLLKVDNVVGKQLKRVQPENGNGNGSEKAAIDFVEIKEKNKTE